MRMILLLMFVTGCGSEDGSNSKGVGLIGTTWVTEKPCLYDAEAEGDYSQYYRDWITFPSENQMVTSRVWFTDRRCKSKASESEVTRHYTASAAGEFIDIDASTIKIEMTAYTQATIDYFADDTCKNWKKGKKKDISDCYGGILDTDFRRVLVEKDVMYESEPASTEDRRPQDVDKEIKYIRYKGE